MFNTGNADVATSPTVVDNPFNMLPTVVPNPLFTNQFLAYVTPLSNDLKKDM